MVAYWQAVMQYRNKYQTMKKILFVVALIIPTALFAQKQQKFNLYKLLKSKSLQIINREVEAIDTVLNKYIKVSEKEKEGIIWLPIKSFKNGTITIEMRGKNVVQRSFIGVAFHGLSDSTYDAVYCRPFNFLATDSVRKIHAIQYISHPNFTWKKLREERNAVFEKEITNPPKPNNWFTMKLEVNNKVVKAYINQANNPSLVVKKLNNRKNGKLGIFVGDNSGGDFKDLNIQYAKK